MSELSEYVLEHTARHVRGTASDVVDVVYFSVEVRPGSTAQRLKELILSHVGWYGPLNLFDGKEHGYIGLGAWVGDQGVALALMGLGAKLELWSLLTPRAVLGADIAESLESKLASQGMISVVVPLLSAVPDSGIDS